MASAADSPAPRRLLTRRTFAGTLLGVPALVGLYAWRVEPHWLEIVERDLPIANLPPALEGRILVQMSDLHIGRDVDDEYIVNTFQRIAALQPDFIVNTGDCITYQSDATIEQAKRVLTHYPQARIGNLAVPGNHDYGYCWANPVVAKQIEQILTSQGVTVLRNRTTEIAGLQFAGLDDLWSGRLSTLETLHNFDPLKPAIALCHNPDACDLPGWKDYHGWILSGHTHGGQCKPPFLPPPLLPVRNKRYAAGAYDLSGDRQLYINRGVGHLLRVRFNVRPEVTRFRLIQA